MMRYLFLTEKKSCTLSRQFLRALSIATLMVRTSCAIDSVAQEIAFESDPILESEIETFENSPPPAVRIPFYEQNFSQESVSPLMFHKTSNKKENILNPRVLSIDGGGSRGYMELLFLCWLTRYIEKPVHELFDNIIATSTGALIAAGLATPKKYTLPKPKFNAPDTGSLGVFHRDPPKSPFYTPDDILVLYQEKSKDIFSGRDFMGRYPYPDKNFNDIIQKLFQLPGDLSDVARGDSGVANYNGSILLPLPDFMQMADHKKDTVKRNTDAELAMRDLGMSVSFTAYDMSKGERFVVSREDAINEPDKNFRVWEVVRTAAAAPTIFTPTDMLKPGIPTCDAGIVCNNPSFIGMTRAAKEYGVKPHKIILLSLGGGRLINKFSFRDFCDMTNYTVSGDNILTSFILSRAFDGHNEHLNVLEFLRGYYFEEEIKNIYCRISPLLPAGLFITDGKDPDFFAALEKVVYEEIQLMENELINFANILVSGVSVPTPEATPASTPTETPVLARRQSTPIDIPKVSPRRDISQFEVKDVA